MKRPETVVQVADFAVGREPALLVAVGLGSCVAILLNDPEAAVGAMAHALLPRPIPAHRKQEFHTKFASSAVPFLVEQLARNGAKSHRLQARLVGGASMFGRLLGGQGTGMGQRNVIAAHEALRAAGIPLRGEDVGGEWGRTVRFDPATGRTVVTSVGRDCVEL